MNNELISREDLNKTIDKITWYHINPYGELVKGAHGDSDALYKAEDIYNAIDNASTVSDRYDEGFRDGYAQCFNDREERKENSRLFQKGGAE